MRINIIFSVLILVASCWAPSAATDKGFYPDLDDEKQYSEYWEQQYLFDSGALLTSQFLIANLPLSEHHGMMVATLKLPGRETIVVKNGRNKDGWSYNGATKGLGIFQHEVWPENDAYLMRLKNTAAEVDAAISIVPDTAVVMPEGNAYGLPNITLYAAPAIAFGRWRAGPEIGGEGDEGDWTPLGIGVGYGLHVRQSKAPNAVIKRWQKFIPTENSSATVPILNFFEFWDGRTVAVLLLHRQKNGWWRQVVECSTATEIADASVACSNDETSIDGTFGKATQVEEFNLQDELNVFEKMAAGSLADISRMRAKVPYRLRIEIDQDVLDLQGEALLEDNKFKAYDERPQKARRRR